MVNKEGNNIFKSYELEINTKACEFSPAGSVCSVASVSAQPLKEEENYMNLVEDMQIQSVTKQTPSSVKRLIFVVCTSLIAIVILTSIILYA